MILPARAIGSKRSSTQTRASKPAAPVSRRQEQRERSSETDEAPLLTPDKRYIIVRGRLWRAANPELPAEIRQSLTHALMSARRAVAAARRSGGPSDLKSARTRVHAAKVGLGERGPVWWSDTSADYTHYLVKNTPYASWYASLAAPVRVKS